MKTFAERREHPSLAVGTESGHRNSRQGWALDRKLLAWSLTAPSEEGAASCELPRKPFKTPCRAPSRPPSSPASIAARKPEESSWAAPFAPAGLGASLPKDVGCGWRFTVLVVPLKKPSNSASNFMSSKNSSAILNKKRSTRRNLTH